jgi:hypothetical protein
MLLLVEPASLGLWSEDAAAGVLERAAGEEARNGFWSTGFGLGARLMVADMLVKCVCVFVSLIRIASNFKRSVKSG